MTSRLSPGIGVPQRKSEEDRGASENSESARVRLKHIVQQQTCEACGQAGHSKLYSK
jgi:type IV pilus biogenesis protein CpaD/CtpE